VGQVHQLGVELERVPGLNDLKRSINIELALDEPPPPPFPNRVDLPRIVQPPENQQVARTPSLPVEAADLPAADKPVEPS
jgi:hypothetical protein